MSSPPFRLRTLGAVGSAAVLVAALPLLEPLLEQAANATRAATEPSAPSVRSLNGGELMNQPPQR